MATCILDLYIYVYSCYRCAHITSILCTTIKSIALVSVDYENIFTMLSQLQVTGGNYARYGFMTVVTGY
jgi:hypothetical protein